MNVVAKVCSTLGHIKELPGFSLTQCVVGFLSAGEKVKKRARTKEETDLHGRANQFLGNGALSVLKAIWEARKRASDEGCKKIENFFVECAAELVAEEARGLTDGASEGDFLKDAQNLRITASTLSIDTVENFSFDELNKTYEKTMPHFQTILKSAIGKPDMEKSADEKGRSVPGRNPRNMRVVITSIALQARSRLTNYLPMMLSVAGWGLGIPRRMVGLMNRLGLGISYPQRSKAIEALARSSVQRAREAANRLGELLMLAYDNFNWRKKMYEVSQSHGATQFDQVSGILIVPRKPDFTGDATSVANDIRRFEAQAGTRLKLPRRQALREITPDLDDMATYRQNIIHHVSRILCTRVPALQRLYLRLSNISDPKAIEPAKTEAYHLPTLDQEQGTINGNITVLVEYLQRTLGLTKKLLEDIVVAVLGDRLTTSRIRSAIGRLSIDRSTFKADKLQGLMILPGLMHVRLNAIEMIIRNMWGKRYQKGRQGKAKDVGDKTKAGPGNAGRRDAGEAPELLSESEESLSDDEVERRAERAQGLAEGEAEDEDDARNLDAMTLENIRNQLKNRSSLVTPTKVDFYAWLQFFEVVLDGACVSALVQMLGGESEAVLASEALATWTIDDVRSYATKITDAYIIAPSESSNEDKDSPGSVLKHTQLLMHDLMLLRETTDAIRNGHPSRILCCLKYWCPMFYCGNSFNYSHELMDLLHNLIHDWPKDVAQVYLESMLVNPKGLAGHFHETDLFVEHFNKAIKDLIQGPNTSPETLARQSAAIFPVKNLIDQMFAELGVEHQDSEHKEVRTHEDVMLLAKYFIKVSAHNPSQHTPSARSVKDLFRQGLRRLSGVNGGHSIHLRNYNAAKLRREGKPAFQEGRNIIRTGPPSVDEGFEVFIGRGYESDIEEEDLDDEDPIFS